jgi:hypothetical protein
MNLERALLIGLLVFGVAHAASAQQTPVDVKRLPVDLTKITRDLRQSAATETRNGGLRIRYNIAVYGAAPRIELFTKQDNIANGPVPYGAPSHRDFIEHNTPIEYRAPGADLGALLFWLAEKAGKK